MSHWFVIVGGAYSLFAGRDATRALSKMQLDPSLFSNEYDDLLDLTEKERATARSWHEDFRGKIFRTKNQTESNNFILFSKKNTILSVDYWSPERKALSIQKMKQQSMAIIQQQTKKLNKYKQMIYIVVLALFFFVNVHPIDITFFRFKRKTQQTMIDFYTNVFVFWSSQLAGDR